MAHATSYEAWNPDTAAAILRAHAGEEGSLLPILHDVQEAFGYVPREIEPMIAEALSLSRAEVHGVVTFYHDFREKPAGRHVLKICRAEACQSAGGEALAHECEQKLGIKFGTTTDDGRVTLEPVYCLGLCSVSPSAMLDGKIVGRLDAKKLDRLIAETA